MPSPTPAAWEGARLELAVEQELVGGISRLGDQSGDCGRPLACLPVVADQYGSLRPR